MTTTHSAIQFDRDLYVPQMATITEVQPMTKNERFFRLELKKPLHHKPGQFVMVSYPGVGEAAISISSGPREDNILEMVIRKAGSLTQLFHNLQKGDKMGIRGPFGSHFKLEDFYGKDVLFVAGGLGLVPLRSLIQPVVSEAEKFGKVTIVSGCRTPADELFRSEVLSWSAKENVEVIRLVDRADEMPWDGEVGLVTAPLSRLDIDVEKTLAVLCGPPVMYKFVIMELTMRGLPTSQIFVDLERRMKCGVGKCGHCQINNLYCCQSGPVFRYSDIQNLREALL